MGMEQVLSDRDSEDEVDDDVADFEDRRVYMMNTDLYVVFLFHMGLMLGEGKKPSCIHSCYRFCKFFFSGMNMDGSKMSELSWVNTLCN